MEPSEAQFGTHRGRVRLSKDGSPHLRNAIYKMTCAVVWHEPTFGLPCFQRLLKGAAYVPTILHVGRKLTSTALALLKSDCPFAPPFSDYQAAKTQPRELQAQYLTARRRKKGPAPEQATPAALGGQRART